MALNYICNIQLSIFNIVVCVDSNSAIIMCIAKLKLHLRWDAVYKVKYLILCIMSKGTEFSWVPSHCGLYWNEISDTLATQGAYKKNF